LYAQWFRLNWMPAFRIDHYPALYIPAGVGVMIFELAFIFLLFFPRIRNFAAVGGLLFHFSIYFFAHINFWTLALCYVVFIDFESLYQRLEKKQVQAPAMIHRQSENVNRKSQPILIVGSLLLAINTLCGLALIDSWPFAVYPTFASVEEKYVQSLTLSLGNFDGTTTEIIPSNEQSFQSKIHPSRFIGLCTQVLWARDSAEVKKRGTALLYVLAEDDARLRQAKSITLYKDICSVVPEERNRNPVRRELLFNVQQ
jgi:hypothetical protein